MCGGTHNEDDVFTLCLAGRMQLWTEGESAVVTEIVQFPRMKALTVFLASGKLEEVSVLMPQVEAFALKNGCTRLNGILARKGWERFMGTTSHSIGNAVYKEL